MLFFGMGAISSMLKDDEFTTDTFWISELSNSTRSACNDVLATGSSGIDVIAP